MSNKVYDVLKVVACVLLPLAEFITALGTIWGWPLAPAIAATITAFHAFLGAVLVKTSADYNKGL